MGLSEEINHYLAYSHMPKDLRAFVRDCLTRDDQINQQRAVKAALNTVGGIGFASPRHPHSPKASETARSGSVVR